MWNASCTKLGLGGSLAARSAMSACRFSTNPKTTQSPNGNLVQDTFAALRWRAAETLTSFLSQEERSHLLKKLDAVEESQVQEETKKTIGEAVIAARTEEAKRQEAKWEREKEALLREAEQAARDRVENDLRIQQRRLALERWKQDVERENAQTKEPGEAVEQVQQEAHPVLGPTLVDMGYKRVHMVSAKTLGTIPVWKKQRIYRHDRAKSMASDKSKTPHLGLPGIIALHEDGDGKLSILDGQHRVGMMAILEEKATEIDIDLENVLVEVFPEQGDNTDRHAQDIFTEINKAEPIKLVDMPGVASKTDRKVINDGASRLQEQFPDMFKPSQQCRAPHLNIDNLRDALFASEVIKKRGIKSSKALMEWMLAQNDVLAAKFERDEEASKVNKAALSKAVKYKFFLGLDSSWLYN